MRTNYVHLSILALILLIAIESSPGQTELTTGSQIVSDARPLAQVATLLQRNFAKVITYEDPVWVWASALQAAGQANPNEKWALIPMTRALSIPLLPNASLDIGEVIGQAVAQYNSKPNDPQFAIITWELGYHLIPTRVHNKNGVFVDAFNPLDSVISVPEQERSSIEHFQQLCNAVSTASGIPIKLMPPGIRPEALDRLFASEPAPFTWGASTIKAREALSELVLRSASTLSWQLRCQPSAQAQDRFCFLNIQPLEVNTTDPTGKSTTQILSFDRCGKCPHRNSSAPVAPPLR